MINGNYALEAGLEPARDALGLESAQNNPYANILVTTPALRMIRGSASWRGSGVQGDRRLHSRKSYRGR